MYYGVTYDVHRNAGAGGQQVAKSRVLEGGNRLSLYFAATGSGKEELDQDKQDRAYVNWQRKARLRVFKTGAVVANVG